MVRSMEGIIFATALGLNMGYYHTKIDTNSQRLFTIKFHLVKYKNTRLPMCIKIAPDIFQNVISKLAQDMAFVKSILLNDMLIITIKSFNDHLAKLEMILARLLTAGIKVNAF
jgi:dihydroorotate dehydrogenase